MREQFRTEDDYFGTRTEQLLAALERDHALSRRQLLKLGAAGLPLLAGLRAAGLAGARAGRQRLADREAAAAGVVHELRHERRDALGVGPGARLHDAERALLRPRPHGHARGRRAELAAEGVRHGTAQPAGRDRAVQFSLDDLHRLPAKTITSFIECAGNGRSFFASQQGTPARRHAVDARRDRRRALDGRPPRRRARARGHPADAVDVMPSGLDAPCSRTASTRATCAARSRSAKALDDALLAYEMNGKPLPLDHGYPLRLVVPGLGRGREHQVGRADRGLATAALLALEHDAVRADRPDVHAARRC